MFWIKAQEIESIVIDVYGGDNKPVIDGYGYQASILIFNDQNIEINNLEITNSFSHIDQNISTFTQTPNLFYNGPNDLWTNVYTSCIMGDGNNGSSQTFEINTDKPARARCLL